MRTFLLALLLLPAAVSAQQPDTTWQLTASTLRYHVSHPLHDTDGISHEARGKGVCLGGACDFLVAAPVKSFTSGDSNRDLHMLQVVRGAEHPLVTVRTRIPEATATAASDTFSADIDIDFAGQHHTYPQIPFHRTTQGNTEHITATVPATLTDFKIDPPSFLMRPLRNEMPIAVDLTWQHP